jgi:uncharacterized damage-inducible protein DinB
MIPRPIEGEYAPYAIKYIDQVPHGSDILFLLENNLYKTKAFFEGIDPEKENYKYADDKWTIKEVLQHIIDTERIFSYRALCYARYEKKTLTSYDENEYAVMSFCEHKSMKTMLQDYENVRNATVSLFDSFEKTVYDNAGKWGEHQLSVRAVAYILAGHEMHHMNVIKVRYF